MAALPADTLLAAVLGVCTALSLGGAGFGLGCLYAQATHSEPRPGPMASISTASLARESAAPAATEIMDAMGGPEDSTPTATVAPVLRAGERLGTPMAMDRAVAATTSTNV